MPKFLDRRSQIEIQLATYLEIALISVDEETIRYVNQQIAELEQKLRDIED